VFYTRPLWGMGLSFWVRFDDLIRFAGFEGWIGPTGALTERGSNGFAKAKTRIFADFLLKSLLLYIRYGVFSTLKNYRSSENLCPSPDSSGNPFLGAIFLRPKKRL